jgi:preprotein translocase subunit YajC
MGALLILVVTFLLIWGLFIVPQQRRVKAHQALVTRLEVGDEVMTSTGLYGTITELDDEIAWLELAPGTVVRSARGAIARRLAEEQADAPPASTPSSSTTSPSSSRPASTAADRALGPDPTET